MPAKLSILVHAACALFRIDCLPTKLLIRPTPDLPALVRVIAKSLVPVKSGDTLHVLRIEVEQLAAVSHVSRGWRSSKRELTVKFSFCLCSFELFGTTATPRATCQLKTTWAGEALYFSASSAIVGSESTVLYPVQRRRQIRTTHPSEHYRTSRRVCRQDDTLLIAVVLQILLC